MQFEFAPRSDFDALKARLASTGRLHIPAVFTEETARGLHATLTKETEWSLSVANVLDMKAMQLSALSLEQREFAVRTVEENARRSFYYVFDTCRIADAIVAGDALAEANRRFFLFLNSRPFLDFARTLTGDARINYVDMQATRYRPGHFLSTHTDDKEGKDRLYAYVFNVTPKWRPDWGGILLFTDEQGNVVEGFTPAFNALNILKVPQPHSVSMVAPQADGARYSYTGWMRAVDSPPHIPGLA